MRPTQAELEVARAYIVRVRSTDPSIKKADELLVCAAVACRAGECGSVPTVCARMMGKTISKPKQVTDWVARLEKLEHAPPTEPKPKPKPKPKPEALQSTGQLGLQGDVGPRVPPRGRWRRSKTGDAGDIGLQLQTLVREFLHEERVPTPWYIVVPEGNGRTVWDAAVLLLILVSAVSIPGQLAFSGLMADGLVAALTHFNTALLVVYGLDLVLWFFASFQEDSGEWAITLDRIVANYLRTWFVVDLVAVVQTPCQKRRPKPRRSPGSCPEPYLSSRPSPSLSLTRYHGPWGHGAHRGCRACPCSQCSRCCG